MFFRIIILFLVAMLGYFPVVTRASCTTVIYQINKDIEKNSTQLQSKHFPWMETSWLMQKLGLAKHQAMSTGLMQYEWRCPEDNEMFLSILIDRNNKIIRVNGQYNSEAESGLFSADLSKKNSTEMPPSLPSRAQEPFQTPSQIKNNSLCQMAILQIQADAKKYGIKIQDQHLPWMNLSWLQQNLGQAQLGTMTQSLYQWNNFSLFKSDDSTATLGTLPLGVKNKTPEEISAVLGNPTVSSENLNQYKWTCPNTSSTLTLTTTQSGIMTKMSGQGCNEAGCSVFAFLLGQSDLAKKLNATASQEIQKGEQALLTNAIKDYNQFFKTTFQNESQLNADMTNRVKNYYTNLRQCTKGSYQYALPVPMLGIIFPYSIIQGKQNNKCIVETSYTLPGMGKVTSSCQFSLENLALFTDQEAEQLAKGNTPSQKIVDLQTGSKAECSMSMNEEKK